MSASSAFHIVLMVCMGIMMVLMLIAIIRTILGPKLSDRVIAVNMVGTLVIAVIAILSIDMEEGFLADICLIYALISFLAVVVLTRIRTGLLLKKRDLMSRHEAIELNVTQQAVKKTGTQVKAAQQDMAAHEAAAVTGNEERAE